MDIWRIFALLLSVFIYLSIFHSHMLPSSTTISPFLTRTPTTKTSASQPATVCHAGFKKPDRGSFPIYLPTWKSCDFKECCDFPQRNSPHPLK